MGNDRTFCLWDIGSGELRAFHRTDSGVHIFAFCGRWPDVLRGRRIGDCSGLADARVAAQGRGARRHGLPPSRSANRRAAVGQGGVFPPSLPKAKKPAEKAELARKLLAHSSESADDNERYVILEQARDLAAQAGEGALLCQAIDALTATYAVDPLPVATAGLELLPAQWGGDESGRSGRRSGGDRRALGRAQAFGCGIEVGRSGRGGRRQG